ncbi:MAG: CoA pyrophosphatase [Anaeromyxobacter sp.]
MTLARLAAALQAFTPGVAPVERIPPDHLPEAGFGLASVLVPLFEREGQVHVLLTRRPATLRLHAGQVSFPGGRVEPGERSLDAALREAQEEIGLPVERTKVLGQLSETLVLSSAFRLTPWVASVPYPYPYAAAPAEVEAILEVPLAALEAPGAHRVEPREVYGMPFDVHFYTAGPDVVWGATGRVLAELLKLWRTA